MLKKKIILQIKLFSMPIIAYLLFVYLRLLGVQPEAEGEMGDMLTAINFLFGAFVAYLVFIMFTLKQEECSERKVYWWWFMSLLLITLALDELFMIHELLGEYLQIKDTFIFLGYGAMLGVLLLFKLKDTLTKSTFSYLLLFTVFTVISQGADYLFNEGLVTIFNKEISYEQFFESFGALCLSSAVATIALRYINLNESS